MTIQVQFTRDGRPTGHPVEAPLLPREPQINDVHFTFERGATEAPSAQFTRDGETVGKPIPAPKGADDVGFEFHTSEDGSVVMRDMHWTKGGKLVGDFVPPPPGSNDAHLTVPGGKITGGFWTRDGERLDPERVGDIAIPGHGFVNDAHLARQPPRFAKDIGETDAESGSTDDCCGQGPSASSGRISYLPPHYDDGGAGEPIGIDFPVPDCDAADNFQGTGVGTGVGPTAQAAEAMAKTVATAQATAQWGAVNPICPRRECRLEKSPAVVAPAAIVVTVKIPKVALHVSVATADWEAYVICHCRPLPGGGVIA